MLPAATTLASTLLVRLRRDPAHHAPPPATTQMLAEAPGNFDTPLRFTHQTRLRIVIMLYGKYSYMYERMSFLHIKNYLNIFSFYFKLLLIIIIQISTSCEGG